MKVRIICAVVCVSLAAFSCGGKNEEKKSSTPKINFKVKTTWPHDTEAFIQGLVIHDGVLYESTGQDDSWIGIVDIKTGIADKKIVLDKKYFGEGIAILNNKVYQLTWKHKVGFIYDLKTFKKLGEFNYSSEGWGITHNNVNLIMSDGTDKLTFLDTATLKPIRTVSVTDDNGVVDDLNELEFAEGFIYANQWQTNNIVKIDPSTGKVVGSMDLTSLADNARLRNPSVDVLNGIAYHSGTKLLVVTGKNWPSFYVLQLSNTTP